MRRKVVFDCVYNETAKNKVCDSKLYTQFIDFPFELLSASLPSSFSPSLLVIRFGLSRFYRRVVESIGEEKVSFMSFSYSVFVRLFAETVRLNLSFRS